MKFLLILALFDGESIYVVDYDLTAADCETRIEVQEDLLTQTFASNDFELWCEMDVGDY